jgi:hypothetical protein
LAHVGASVRWWFREWEGGSWLLVLVRIWKRLRFARLALLTMPRLTMALLTMPRLTMALLTMPRLTMALLTMALLVLAMALRPACNGPNLLWPYLLWRYLGVDREIG